MSNHDEVSEMGSLERETRRDQLREREALDARLERERLERVVLQARLAELNVPFEQRLAPNEPDGDNPFEAGRDVQFELPAALRAAAAGRNRVPLAPAAGSVASQATVAVFGRVHRRTLEDMALDEVIVRKEDRGVLGSKIFVANRAAATLGLPQKFLGSIHLQSKNAAGEQMQKAKNIQDQFVSNLDVMAKFAERIKQYDMLLPLQIPKDYNDVVDVEARWDMDNPDREIVNLSIHWGALSAEHVYNWQRDFNGYSFPVDHVSSVFLKDLMANSTFLARYLQPRGVIGCYLSHRTFWQLTVDRNYSSAIIVEDDILTEGHFLRSFGWTLL